LSVTTPNDFWTDKDLKDLSISPENVGDLLSQVATRRTRWSTDVFKQSVRVQQRGRKAILNLVFFPVDNKSTMDLDNPNCRLEKVISAFEMEDGPLVISTNMRTDCIRAEAATQNPRNGVQRQGRYTHECQYMTAMEWIRCKKLIVHELKLAKEIIGIDFVSVITMSSV
jgi:hypothetical protein